MGDPTGSFASASASRGNLAISEVRRTRAKAVPDEDLEQALAVAEQGSGTSDGPDPLLRGVLAQCHERLPEKPRQALDARISSEGGASDDDLAQAIGMRLNTFLQNFTRARRMLAECLKKAGVAFHEELGA